MIKDLVSVRVMFENGCGIEGLCVSLSVYIVCFIELKQNNMEEQ